MSVEIVPATLRDLTYIAANMRPDDRTEIECQMEAWDYLHVAAISLREEALKAAQEQLSADQGALAEKRAAMVEKLRAAQALASG